MNSKRRGLVDLTMPITPGMAAYPGEPSASFDAYTTIENDDVAMASVTLFSQLGTHIDAPAHFVRGGRTVDQLDLARCVGEAVAIQLGPLEAGSLIDTALLETHRSMLETAERVIVSTGWSRRAGSPNYFRDWPEFTLESVEYLAEFDLLFVGLDTPSPGNDSNNQALHRVMFREEIALVECLVNVDELPAHFELVCLPLPLVGLDGSPVRAIALPHSDL